MDKTTRIIIEITETAIAPIVTSNGNTWRGPECRHEDQAWHVAQAYLHHEGHGRSGAPTMEEVKAVEGANK